MTWSSPLQHTPTPLHGTAKHYLRSHDTFSPQQALLSSLHSSLHIMPHSLLFSETHFQTVSFLFLTQRG